MPKIDYYILNEGDAKTRFTLACRLVEKAYKNQHRIYLYTANATDAHYIDELLWTYRDDSFLPHNLCGEGPDTPPPIQIGYDNAPKHQRDIMINLTPTIPAFVNQFNRVLEIVPNEPELQQQSRENYRLYRAQGYDMTTHKLQSIEV